MKVKINLVAIPVSIGELWDKYTILQIKEEKISDSNKLALVKNELQYLKNHISVCFVYITTPNNITLSVNR